MHPRLSISSVLQYLVMNTVYVQGLPVTLVSTLNAELTAHPQDIVIFTCTTRGSGVLNWFSDEYIGTDGLPLQLIAAGNTTTVQSNSDPNTVATRISITNGNGAIVIVSELRITASLLHMMAAVSCDDGGIQSRQSISFRTTTKEDVTLNSTLNAELTAYPQKKVVFTCTTKGSGILNWFSDEYIGTDGLPLQIIAAGNTTTVQNSNDPNTVATRVSVNVSNGEIVIVSELRIVTSVQYLGATVSCDNGGVQSRQSISFRLINRSDEVTSTTGTATSDGTATIHQTQPDVNIIGPVLAIGGSIFIIIVIVAIVIIIVKVGRSNRRIKNGSEEPASNDIKSHQLNTQDQEETLEQINQKESPNFPVSNEPTTQSQAEDQLPNDDGIICQETHETNTNKVNNTVSSSDKKKATHNERRRLTSLSSHDSEDIVSTPPTQRKDSCNIQTTDTEHDLS